MFETTNPWVVRGKIVSSGVNVDTVVWIVIAVVVVLALIALALFLARKRKESRRVQAGQIREQASERVAGVRKREAIAEEHAANARRAQAEADAKAAEAKRLAAEASTHQGTAASKRQELDAEFQRADKLDPDVGRNGRDDNRHDNGNRMDPRQAGNGPGNGLDPRHTGNGPGHNLDPRQTGNGPGDNGSHVPRHNR